MVSLNHEPRILEQPVRDVDLGVRTAKDCEAVCQQLATPVYHFLADGSATGHLHKFFDRLE